MQNFRHSHGKGSNHANAVEILSVESDFHNSLCFVSMSEPMIKTAVRDLVVMRGGYCDSLDRDSGS